MSVRRRVPFRNLIDYLEHGYSLEEFLDAFPSVTREQVVAALAAAHEALALVRSASTSSCLASSRHI